MVCKVQACGWGEWEKLHPALEPTTSQNLKLYFRNYLLLKITFSIYPNVHNVVKHVTFTDAIFSLATYYRGFVF
jgi:hypothetical protein